MPKEPIDGDTTDEARLERLATDEDLDELPSPEEERNNDFWCDEEDDIYGPDGDIVYSRYYEAQKVDRTCGYCKRVFRGMPDHGVCDSCADRIERGEDLYY